MATTVEVMIDEQTEVTTTLHFPWRPLVGVLLLALLGRVLLLASGTVSFHSDEAVIGLMARHILDGARPTFFYGQAYMGSLDAFLVAIGFATLGESVMTIRIVQAILYLLVVAAGYFAAWRLSGRALVATVAALVLAIPPVLLTVYTTATLGGYNETLLFGSLLLLLGYEVTHEQARSWWRWALLGVIAGLSWWTNGLVIAYAMPVALMILYRVFRPARTMPALSLQMRILLLFVALVGFFVGSAPWWIFNLNNDWAALAFYIVRTDEGQFAGNSVPSLPFDQRVLGLVFLGLPTLIGLRFPWADWFFAPLVGSVVLFVYGVAIYRLARHRTAPDGQPTLKPDARAYVLGMLVLFCALFFVSKFSIDPTGRYFLPLTLPLGITLGALVATIPSQRIPRRWLQVGILGLVLGYHAAGQMTVARTSPGFTTQFNLDSHITNAYDDDLIAWLDEHDIHAGYTTYWVSFRLAFLSGERMQFSSALPYKPNLEYTLADERYPAYKAAADSTDRIAYITANVPAVRERLEAIFAERGITYQQTQVGPFEIYYDFHPDVPRPPLPFGSGS